MKSDTNEILQRELGRAITELATPDELPYFDEVVDASMNKSNVRSDHVLGFGVSEGMTAMVATFAYAAAANLLQLLWEAAKPSVQELAQKGAAEVSSLLTERFKAWIDNRFRTPPPAELTVRQRDEFLHKWLEEASRSGLSEADLDKFHAALRQATDAN